MASVLSLSLDQHGKQTPPPTHPDRRQVSYPHIYQTPSSVSNFTHPISNQMHGAHPPRSLSISLHTPLNLRLDPPPMDQVLVPTMPYIGPQSFSGSLHSGNVHGLRSDLGYALLRPGVVPGGPGGINQIPVMSPMYVHHRIPAQPHVYQVQSYMNSSGYNGTNDMGQILSNQQNGMSFAGPMSPQNRHPHHVHVPQDDFRGHGSYSYGSNQVQHTQQYSYDPGYDEYLNKWSDLHSGNYRGRSM